MTRFHMIKGYLLFYPNHKSWYPKTKTKIKAWINDTNGQTFAKVSAREQREKNIIIKETSLYTFQEVDLISEFI